MALTLTVNGVTFPTPSKKKESVEKIWSSDTGRTMSGLMTGTVIAEKLTVHIEWNLLTRAEVDSIRSAIRKGFFTVSDSELGTYTMYAGKFEEGDAVVSNGDLKRQNASLDLIER